MIAGKNDLLTKVDPYTEYQTMQYKQCIFLAVSLALKALCELCD